MPPRRKRPTASTSQQPAKPPPPKQRRSKLAKENDLTADEETEIREAFALFAAQHDDDNHESSSKEGVIARSDVRRCLIALNAPPKDGDELHELLDAVDPDEVGWVDFEPFVAIAALKLHARRDNNDDDDPDAVNEEVVKAYRLFTKGRDDRPITLVDLRRVAKELREEVPESVLKDMLREATGGGLGGVGLEDFEGVMRRAGVFG